MAEDHEVAAERQRDEEQRQQRRGGDPHPRGQHGRARVVAPPGGPQPDRGRGQGQGQEADEVRPALLEAHLRPERAIDEVGGRRRDVMLEVDADGQVARVPVLA